MCSNIVEVRIQLRVVAVRFNIEMKVKHCKYSCIGWRFCPVSLHSQSGLPGATESTL